MTTRSLRARLDRIPQSDLARLEHEAISRRIEKELSGLSYEQLQELQRLLIRLDEARGDEKKIVEEEFHEFVGRAFPTPIAAAKIPTAENDTAPIDRPAASSGTDGEERRSVLAVQGMATPAEQSGCAAGRAAARLQSMATL